MPVADVARRIERRMRAVPRAALLALALAWGAALGAQQAPAPATATLQGRVTQAGSDTGIASAAVLITGTLLHTVTEGDGSFKIIGIAPGTYTVRVLRIGFEPVSREVTLAAGDVLTLNVSLAVAPVTLAPVTVTASGFTRQVGDVPASQAVVPNTEITNRNVVTLDQVMPFVAGVTMNNGSIDIRGSSGVAGGVGSRVLVMLDSHPLLSADGGEVDFAALPLPDIERVEIVKGAYSALYGSNALGGVVNVITKPIDQQPEWLLGLRYGAWDYPEQFKFTNGTRDLVGGQVQYSSGLGQNSALRLFLDRGVSDGYTVAGEANRWLFKGAWDLNPYGQHPVSVYAVYASEDNGGFFTWKDPQHPYEPDSGTAPTDFAHSTKLSTGARIVTLSHAASQLELLPYLEYNTTKNHFIENQDFHDAMKLGLPVQFTMQIAPGHRTILGAELSHTWVTSNFLDRPPDSTVDSSLVYHPGTGDFGLFAQDEWNISQRWSASIGARMDTHSATGSTTETSFNPKLGVVYRSSTHTSWRADIARGYRAPSVIEQFVSTVQYGQRVVPNPDLVGEHAWSAEIGVTTNPVPWWWIDGALFDSEYQGLIGPGLAPGQGFAFQFENLQRARVAGLDLSTKVAVAHDVMTVQLNYMYLYTRDLDLPANFPNTWLPYRSRDNLTATFDFLGGLCGIDFRYRSRVVQVVAYPSDPRGAISILDLRAGYPVLGTLIQLRAQNVLQAKYVDVQERVPGAPRSFLLSVTKVWAH